MIFIIAQIIHGGIFVELKIKEREICNEVNLCDKHGKLNNESIGWARQPIIRCNLSHHNFRKKKWNYWLIISEECLFSATIANLDYAGMVFIYFYDFGTEQFAEKTVTIPLGKKCVMSEGVYENVIYEGKSMRVSFISQNNNTKLNVKCDDFDGGNIDVDLLIERPNNMESLNVVIPWNENTFQFTSKQNCLPVAGKIVLNNKAYLFKKEKNFASLDFGRGVWPYNIMWNWATCSGKFSDKVIGFNLGGTWTDGTGITENGFIVDGIVYKISDDIIFEYEKENILKPWIIRTKSSDMINLKFVPIYKRTAASNVLLIKSTVHQIIGEFSGDIKLKNEEVIHFESIKGTAEEHYAKW